jgi:hypothetical protein
MHWLALHPLPSLEHAAQHESEDVDDKKPQSALDGERGSRLLVESDVEDKKVTNASQQFPVHQFQNHIRLTALSAPTLSIVHFELGAVYQRADTVNVHRLQVRWPGCAN